MTFFLILTVNLLVGLCVGLTGVSGFLLPMFYSGFLEYPSAISLALSFATFLISGILGSVNYYRSRNLDIRIGCILSVGSFVGALLGVRLNLLIPETWIRTILYLVVLGSGLSILIREYQAGRGPKIRAGRGSKVQAGCRSDEKNKTGELSSRPCRSSMFYILLGLATAAVCAASGAGGPVLVIPLLTICGFPPHMAVGIAFFDSIFIALPAAFGYLRAASAVTGFGTMVSWLPMILIFHGIGVFAGSRFAVRINQKLLKMIVAILSISVACLKLGGI